MPLVPVVVDGPGPSSRESRQSRQSRPRAAAIAVAAAARELGRGAKDQENAEQYSTNLVNKKIIKNDLKTFKII